MDNFRRRVIGKSGSKKITNAVVTYYYEEPIKITSDIGGNNILILNGVTLSGTLPYNSGPGYYHAKIRLSNIKLTTEDGTIVTLNLNKSISSIFYADSCILKITYTTSKYINVDVGYTFKRGGNITVNDNTFDVVVPELNNHTITIIPLFDVDEHFSSRDFRNKDSETSMNLTLCSFGVRLIDNDSNNFIDSSTDYRNAPFNADITRVATDTYNYVIRVNLNLNN